MQPVRSSRGCSWAVDQVRTRSWVSFMGTPLAYPAKYDRWPTSALKNGIGCPFVVLTRIHFVYAKFKKSVKPTGIYKRCYHLECICCCRVCIDLGNRILPSRLEISCYALSTRNDSIGKLEPYCWNIGRVLPALLNVLDFEYSSSAPDSGSTTSHYNTHMYNTVKR